MHDLLERVMLRLMPWWDRKSAEEREERAEASRRRAIAARQALEEAYVHADGYVRRR